MGEKSVKFKFPEVTSTFDLYSKAVQEKYSDFLSLLKDKVAEAAKDGKYSVSIMVSFYDWESIKNVIPYIQSLGYNFEVQQDIILYKAENEYPVYVTEEFEEALEKYKKVRCTCFSVDWFLN